MKTTLYTVGAFAALTLLLVGSVTIDTRTKAQPDNEAPQRDNALTDYEVLLLAIAKTESDFDPLARGKADDLGVFQITPVFVREVNRILGDTVYLHEDALDMKKSLEMVTVVQDRYNAEHDITRAIARHNPCGNAIGYARKVRENMAWIRRYEEMRSLIIKEE